MSATYINLPPGSVVKLLGENDDGLLIASTVTDANRTFRFGLLPAGNYRYGSAGGLQAVTLGSGNLDLGNMSANELLISALAVDPGTPTTITWPSTPGWSYRVEYCDVPGGGWNYLAVVTASGVITTYDDFTSWGMRFYRLVAILGDE